MRDPTEISAILIDLINDLDPKNADVAICHLRDAIAALQAVDEGRSTEYAYFDDIRDGRVLRQANVQPIR